MKIAVLGAGNGAHAMAGDLALKGHEVFMWENPAFAGNLDRIKGNGNSFRLTGDIEGTARMACVTTDASVAVRGADIIFCVMPSYGQESAFEHIVPFVEDGQRIFIMPGNFGSISLYMRLKNLGKGKHVLVGEGDTIPYAARLQPDGSCLVFGIKSSMWMSSIPSDRTEELMGALRPAFPIMLAPLPDVLSVALSNTNMILHCPTMIMNAGRIEFCERFRFYNDGMTQSVCRVMEAMDAERLSVGAAWGCNLVTEFDDAISNYSLDRSQYKNLHDIFVNHPVYGNHGPDSPSSMTNRYISEDVPFLLVPVSEMGMMAEVPTPSIDSIIHLAGIVNGIDYRKTGRRPGSMGMDGMSIEAARSIIVNG
jgi:opine dehydrogenase